MCPPHQDVRIQDCEIVRDPPVSTSYNVVNNSYNVVDTSYSVVDAS